MSGVGHGFGFGVHHGRVTASDWTPADLSGIYLWADLDLSTVLTDANGIYSWSDLSGNDNHLVQADDAKKPDLGAAGGIQRTVESGTTDGFDIDTGAKTLSGAFTVATLKYTTGNAAYLLHGTHGLRDVGGGAWNLFSASGSVTFSDADTAIQNEWHVNVLRRDASDNLTARKNGVDTTAGSPNLGGDMTFTNVIRETSTSEFGLNIMVIVDGFVDGDDLALLEAYLLDKIDTLAPDAIPAVWKWWEPADLPAVAADVDSWLDVIDSEDLDYVAAVKAVVVSGPDGHKAMEMQARSKYNGAATQLDVPQWELWAVMKWQEIGLDDEWTWWGWDTNMEGIRTKGSETIALYHNNSKIGEIASAIVLDGEYHLFRVKLDFTKGVMTTWNNGTQTGTDASIGSTQIKMASHIGNDVFSADAPHTYVEWAIFDEHLDATKADALLNYFIAKYPSIDIALPPTEISEIDSLYAWYQPEDLPTSGAVTTWPNSVTPGTFDLVSDLATDPVVGTGTNGVRSVLFSQVTTEALSTVESTNFTQPLEYIVVCMKDSGVATVSLVDSNAGTNRIAMYDPSGDNNCYIYAGAQQASNLIPLDDQWKIWDCLVDGANTRYWLQDTEGTIGNPGAGSQDGLRIGLTGIETGPWDGEICEVLFSDGGFTEQERTLIIDYLKAKYAIA